MSYEEESRRPFKASCACGKGFLRRYQIVEENDWGQTRVSDTPVEIYCDYCNAHYYYAYHKGSDYLVPKGLSFPKDIPDLAREYLYTDSEKFVGNHSKAVIESIIADMTAPKHRFIKDLSYSPAIEFAENWAFHIKKKSLKPMVEYLQSVLSKYDDLLNSYNSKKPVNDAHAERLRQMWEEIEKVEEQSTKVSFLCDEEQYMIDHENAKRERDEHKYDPFMAQVSYHQSYKTDLSGHYWDSFFIKECVDPEYLILNKKEYPPQISIIRKYQCVCTICGNPSIVNSSDFEISYDESIGYYSKACCACHTISSFEAKVMAILNNFCIDYRREVSFEGLVGNTGKPLRFDFALYDHKQQSENDKFKIRLLIELQGPHHYKRGHYNEYVEFIEDDSDITKANHAKQIEYDERKRKYCEGNGLSLECIKYTSGNNYQELEQKIKEILTKYHFVVRD